MNENPISFLRRICKENKFKGVCRVSTHLRVLLEQALYLREKLAILPSRMLARPGGVDSFMNFDGVFVVEDPSLGVEEYRFEDLPESKE